MKLAKGHHIEAFLVLLFYLVILVCYPINVGILQYPNNEIWGGVNTCVRFLSGDDRPFLVSQKSPGVRPVPQKDPKKDPTIGLEIYVPMDLGPLIFPSYWKALPLAALASFIAETIVWRVRLGDAVFFSFPEGAKETNMTHWQLSNG